MLKRGNCTPDWSEGTGLGLSRRGWLKRLKLPILCPFCWLNVKKGGGGERMKEKLQGYICSSECRLSATKSNKQSSQMWVTSGSNLTKAQVLVSSCLETLLPIHSAPLTLTRARAPKSLGAWENRKSHCQAACSCNAAVNLLGPVSRPLTYAPRDWQLYLG